MASVAQVTANRANAQLSTGPRTDAGKAAASRNASSHGLASAAVVLARENAAEFDQLLDTYVDEFAPSSEHQHFLVRQMAEARWRLERIRRIETAVLNQMLTGSFSSDPYGRIAQSMNLRGDAQAKLERYASTAERAYYRAHRELMAERKHRDREDAAQLETALETFLMAPPPRREPSTARPRRASSDLWRTNPVAQVAEVQAPRPLQNEPNSAGPNCGS